MFLYFLSFSLSPSIPSSHCSFSILFTKLFPDISYYLLPFGLCFPLPRFLFFSLNDDKVMFSLTQTIMAICLNWTAFSSRHARYLVILMSPEQSLELHYSYNWKQKQTPWPVVRKWTIPTERRPLVGEVSANFKRIGGAAWSA
jgi:hypothetical protein